jgi:hypothetical protein
MMQALKTTFCRHRLQDSSHCAGAFAAREKRGERAEGLVVFPGRICWHRRGIRKGQASSGCRMRVSRLAVRAAIRACNVIVAAVVLAIFFGPARKRGMPCSVDIAGHL